MDIGPNCNKTHKMTFQLLLIHKKHQKFLESLSTHSPSKKGIKIGRFFHSIKLLIRQRSLCSQQKYNWIALQLFSFAFIYQKSLLPNSHFPHYNAFMKLQTSFQTRSVWFRKYIYNIKLRICFYWSRISIKSIRIYQFSLPLDMNTNFI